VAWKPREARKNKMSGAIILLLALVFLLAALSKLRDREAFSRVLRQLVPRSLVHPLSVGVPLGEIMLSACLIGGLWPRPVLAASIAILIVFTVVLAYMWRRGLKGCACFGETENNASPIGGIARNLVLIAAAFAAINQSQPIAVMGPDLSSFLGRVTLVAGAFCLWSCLIPLIERRKFLINPKPL
jgi:uncharacterized membrane protein YphA (DoxX/SURF4 family)